MTYHYLHTDTGVRVWSDEDARYGMFTVMEEKDFEQFKTLMLKYGCSVVEDRS